MRDLHKEHDEKAMNEDETERKSPITRRMPWSREGMRKKEQLGLDK